MAKTFENSWQLTENVAMTDERAILAKIQGLPEQLKQEVIHYIEFLRSKQDVETQAKPNRKAGSAEGKYKLSSDFDAPLEDFKEYT